MIITLRLLGSTRPAAIWAGEAFLQSKIEWILEHYKPKKLFRSGRPVGKSHLLTIFYGDKRSTKQKEGQLIVSLAFGESETSSTAQTYISKAVRRALRSEAESYLPARTRQLAELHGLRYKSVSVKQLKRRWGSCNSKKEITFNLSLMELEHPQIDYVILHELCHTRHMNHGSEFWKLMEQVCPGARKVAKTVRRLQV